MDKMANGMQSEEFSGEKESDQQRSFKSTVIKRISTLFAPTISSSRKVNTVKIGQLQAQQNKTPLSRKTHEQPANRSQEKTNSAIRVSIPATKTAGKASALKEEAIDTQTSQPEQSTGVTLSPASRRSSAHNHKTSALKEEMTDTQTSQPEQSTGVTLSPASKKSSVHSHKTSALKEETTDTQTSQPEQSTGVTLSPASRRSSVHNHKTSAVQQGTVKTRTSVTQTAEASTRSKKSSAAPETSTPLQTFVRKRKTQASVSQSRPYADSNKPSSSTNSFSILNDEPVHHIKWDGFNRTHENVGFTCALCEEDLSYMPSDNYESEYYDDLESDRVNYPEVVVLQCGHPFHVRCFANTIPDEQCTDPPCVFCASYLT